MANGKAPCTCKTSARRTVQNERSHEVGEASDDRPLGAILGIDADLTAQVPASISTWQSVCGVPSDGAAALNKGPFKR
jgi:hypothetical protein